MIKLKDAYNQRRFLSKRFYCTRSGCDFKNLVDARIIKTGFDPKTCHFNFQLKNLIDTNQLNQACQLFDQMPQQNTCSVNTMISGYLKLGDLSSARKLFDSMAVRTAVSWTIVIGGYSRHNQHKEAIDVFIKMCRSGAEPDHITFAALLSGCDGTTNAKVVHQIHCHVIKLGFDATLIVSNTLIDSYCKSHCLGLACRLFNEVATKDPVTFNTLISGFSKEGMNKEALELFLEMQNLGLKPSDFTFAAILGAGVGLDDVTVGQQVHALAIKSNYIWNVYVGNAMLYYYSKHDHFQDAKKLFEEMPELDGISYNIIISGYAWDGQHERSLQLFRNLNLTSFSRSQFPFSTMLSIAAELQTLEIGRQLHAQTVITASHFEIQVGNSLVDMYAKCSRFKEASILFSTLDCRDTVSWTAIISAYIQNGFHEEGLNHFKAMQRDNVCSDQATFSIALRACASLASLSLGKQLHSLIIRLGFLFNVFSGSGLVDMYAKCGSIRDAKEVFSEMPERNIVSWNAMISAFAQNGDGEATLRSFQQMIESGFPPDSVSLLSIFTACSHRGLVEQALLHFNSMTRVHKLVPKKEHYTCIIDVLCRSGRFHEAEKLMAQMPFEPDEIMWSSVLNSCRIHKNQELAKQAADKLFRMDALRDGGAYVNMSNIFAEAGDWESAASIKKAMRDRGVKKVRAHSWVELKQKVHIFTSNDWNHPQIEDIRKKINLLWKRMEDEGYRPDLSCSLHNVDIDSRVESLRYHSERLAIAFALINTPEGSPVLVMKNLRACTDCHAAIKVISKIVQREITVRDSSRFHHFKDGHCSCGDYW